MTTTRESLPQPEAIVDEYVLQGFSSIFLRWLSPFGFAVKTGVIGGYNVDEWLAFYKRALAHILQLNRTGTAIREEYTRSFCEDAHPLPHELRRSSVAGWHGDSCAGVQLRRQHFASDEARMLAEMGDHSFRLGHLETNSFLDIVTSDKLLECLEAHADRKHADVRGLRRTALLRQRSDLSSCDPGQRRGL